MPITELRPIRADPSSAHPGSADPVRGPLAWRRPVRPTVTERFAMRAGLALVVWGRARMDAGRATLVRRYRVALEVERARAAAERRYRLLGGR